MSSVGGKILDVNRYEYLCNLKNGIYIVSDTKYGDILILTHEPRFVNKTTGEFVEVVPNYEYYLMDIS